MVCWIKPEHKAPVEAFWRVAGSFIQKSLPDIWNRCYDSIVDMCRSRCCISGLAERTDKLSWLDKIHH